MSFYKIAGILKNKQTLEIFPVISERDVATGIALQCTIVSPMRDNRRILLAGEDPDTVLTGGTSTLRLPDLSATVGTARIFTSGPARNLIIEGQLHTVPMRSLMRVITGQNRKAPVFVPADDVAPD